MISNNPEFNEFKHRVALLQINDKITKEKEKAIIEHVYASLHQGGNELEHYAELSDEDLIK